MNKIKNKKNAMVLAELVFALFICGIILGVSIYMFKSNDVTKTPHIYAVMKNLPIVNKTVMEDCYAEGTCKVQNLLPDDLNEYCARLADSFVTSGTVDCDITGNRDENFRLTNGATFENFIRGVNKNNSTTWSNSNYIDVLLDVNGVNNGNNAIGDDVFPIRIFKNGEVIPSLSGTGANAVLSYNDSEFFAYRVILNRALDDNHKNSRVEEFVNTALTTSRHNAGTENNLAYSDKVSFIDAICAAYTSNTATSDIIPRYFPDVNSITCASNQIAYYCDFDNGPYSDDNTAFCMIEPVKPRGSGIFKIFGI